MVNEIRNLTDLERELSRPSEARHRLYAPAGGRHPDPRRRRQDGTVAGTPLPQRRRRGRQTAAHHRGLAQCDGEPGIEAISCDLLQRDQVAQLPDCPNVLYLAGRKFGSSGNPELTWAMNTVVPAIVAERFPHSRMVVVLHRQRLSVSRAQSGGSVETDAPATGRRVRAIVPGPRARLRILRREVRHAVLLFRLNYAVDLRYGVLVDIARKVHAGDAGGARGPRLQRDLAARRQFLCAAFAGTLRHSAPPS